MRKPASASIIIPPRHHIAILIVAAISSRLSPYIMVDDRDSHSRSPPAEPSTVLVVEDEALTCIDISDFLRGCGFHVIEATNAGEALVEIQNDESIDVVFTDVNMPGEMDGLGLAQWIWRERPDVRVILTSGAAQATTAARALCQEEVFIAKPYARREVERRIRDLLAIDLAAKQ